MTGLDGVVGGFGRWIDAVAMTMAGTADRLTFSRKVALVEEEGGTFELRPVKQRSGNAPAERLQITNGRVTGPVSEKLAAMLRGSRAELRLRPTRFLFRPLELPRRASEFLGGVVRSQIDRLTPWSAGDAVFGFSQPVDVASDRIVVTVAATARAQVEPYVQALADAGVDSITVTTTGEGDSEGNAPITVLEQRTRSILDVTRVRRVLVAVLLLTGLAATASLTSAAIIGHNLAAKQDEFARRIAERRVALRVGGAEPALSPIGKLELRKHESPASVIVIEALSQILPDHTYVTELRIEGDKLRLTGITRDAPSLIRLIEQSSQFTRATFFAPTTRAPSDPGDRFHTEAQIGPVPAPRT
jgi:general secretion pathway protein L